MCVCGACLCDAGYTGSDCVCPISDDVCRPPMPDGSLGDICSGRGSCDCGFCVCDGRYKGQYCNDCDVSIKLSAIVYTL